MVFSSTALEIDDQSHNFFADIYIDLKVKGKKNVHCRVQLPHQHSNGPYRKLRWEKDDFEKEYAQFLYLEQIASGDTSSNLRRDLAQTGHELFCQIFTEEEAAQLARIQSERAAEDIASSDVDGGTARGLMRMYVSSDNLNIPWELLYTRSPLSDSDNELTDIDPTHFLGYHFFIQQDFNDRTQLEHKLKPFEKARGVTVFVDDELPYTYENESPAIQEIFKKAGCEVAEFGELSPFNPFDEQSARLSGRNGEKLGAALKTINSDILHFACHSEQTENGVLLRISRDYYVSEIEVKRSFPDSDQGAFLFFNSCQLAIRSPAKYCQFLSYLATKQFAGIIATEIKVKDEDAFVFAETVYREFTSQPKRSLQEAIFRARRRLLLNQGSFVGFTYSYYGNNDLIIGEN